MPILDNEIVWRPSALISDTTPAQNGGRMAFSVLVSGVKNNLFPDVSVSERAAGSVKWRKAFIHVNSVQDVALLNVRVFLDGLTPAGDFVVFQPGTQTDTENLISGRPYGIGRLHATANSGAAQLQVECENNALYATLQPFRVGDRLRVSNRPSTGGSGAEEWVSVTGVSYGTHFATIDISPALSSDYGTSNTLISSVLELPSVIASVSGVSVTSGNGVFNHGGHLLAHNRGSIAETWTLTFTSATAYSVSGNTVGALTSPGSVNADYAPLNPGTGTPYFTIKSSAWGGTFQAGNTVTFETHPAAIPIWYRRQVPAGTPSLANNAFGIAIHGESA